MRLNNDPVRQHIARINKQYKDGLIDNDTRHRLIRTILTAARFGGMRHVA